MTTSLQKSPGLFSIFWPISIMMVSSRPVISKSSSSCTNSLVTVPRAPITIGIIVTLMLHSFFNSLAKVEILIPLFTFFQFHSMIRKVHNSASSFFIYIKSGRLAEIRGSVCMLKSQRSLCVSFSRTDSRLCIYHLFV